MLYVCLLLLLLAMALPMGGATRAPPTSPPSRSPTVGSTALTTSSSAPTAEPTAEAAAEGRSEGLSGGVITLNLILIFVCIVSAALANGLTQGLLSINPLEMQIKLRSGTADEKVQAQRILPIITRHHLLLCTLMLFNASANEALPLFLDQLVPAWLAIVLAVTIVLLFGEILPGAVFTGKHQIVIASKLTPVVLFLMAVFSPIAYPISKVLDYFVGHSGLTMYNRYEMAAMVHIQQEESRRRSLDGHDHVLNAIEHQEATIIGGALKFRDILVSSVMTPSDKVFWLSASGRLDFKTMSDIFKSGYSRIPICGDGGIQDVQGLMLVKDLIFIDPDDDTPIANFVTVFGRPIIYVWPDQHLHEVLHLFRQGRAHLAIVREVNNNVADRDPYYETRGIITLEDIIGEILGEDIADETDRVNKDHRDIDFARLLTLIGPQVVDDRERVDLSEAKVIANHLITNSPQIRSMFSGKKDLKLLIDLVLNCPVTNLDNVDADESRHYLYTRGEESNTFTLILHGKVAVLAGKDEFKSELGAWYVIGIDALTSEDGTFVPDFTAYVQSESFKCISITRDLMHARSPANFRRNSQGLTSEHPELNIHLASERQEQPSVWTSETDPDGTVRSPFFQV